MNKMNTLKSNNTFSNFTDEELVEKIVLTKNTALFSVTQNDALNQSYLNVIQVAQETGYALLLYVPYENVGLSLEKDITL